MTELGETLAQLGIFGLLASACIWAIREWQRSERRRWIDHGGDSIESRIAKHKQEEGTGYVSSTCHYKLHEQRSAYNASTKSWHKEPAIIFGNYAILAEIDREHVSLWKTQEFTSFKGYWSKWPIYKIPCTRQFELPLAKVARLEIAPFSEMDHRATADSFYIFTVVDGTTHLFGQAITMPDARKLKELVQTYLDEQKGVGKVGRPALAEGIPDDGIPS